MNKVTPLEEISFLYHHYGKFSYEEKCTQLEHAQQCGTLALEYGWDEEIALAAFLHDIGHFIAQRDSYKDFTRYGYAQHATLGATYLQELGFSKRIVNLVSEHVNVKRYLAAIDEHYLSQLSDASRATLQQQGGVMSPDEVQSYRKQKYLGDIIKLRQLDDSGKQPNMACKSIEFWLELAYKLLN